MKSVKCKNNEMEFSNLQFKPFAAKIDSEKLVIKQVINIELVGEVCQLAVLVVILHTFRVSEQSKLNYLSLDDRPHPYRVLAFNLQK